MSEYDSIEIGIDIGSSKTVAVVSQNDLSLGQLLILGVGECPNPSGVKQGKVLDIASTVQSIRKAAEQAMITSGFQFASANVSVPAVADCINSTGIVTIARKDREVQHRDISRVIKQSELVNLPVDRTIIHLFPQYFTLDEQDDIKDPIGMNGLRLTGRTHLITILQTVVNGVVKCLDKADLAPVDAMFPGYASSLAVLSEEEKELGVLLLDIGAGMTHMMGFTSGYPIFSGTTLLGGESITRDISIGLKIQENVAENLKRESGSAFSQLIDPVMQVDIPGVRPGEIKRISLQDVSNIIQMRAEEILQFVRQALENKNIPLSSFSSIVLTGGTSLLSGLPELVEFLFGLPARIGQPGNLGGLSEQVENPMYSTAIGLCMGDMGSHFSKEQDLYLKKKKGKGIWYGAKKFIKDIFG